MNGNMNSKAPKLRPRERESRNRTDATNIKERCRILVTLKTDSRRKSRIPPESIGALLFVV